MFTIPDDFLHRPFARLDALGAGVPARVLEGTRFRWLHKGVYVHRDIPVTEWIKARGALLLCHNDAAASHHTAARI